MKRNLIPFIIGGSRDLLAYLPTQIPGETPYEEVSVLCVTPSLDCQPLTDNKADSMSIHKALIANDQISSLTCLGVDGMRVSKTNAE